MTDWNAEIGSLKTYVDITGLVYQRSYLEHGLLITVTVRKPADETVSINSVITVENSVRIK
mgnify:CR=1 FL=1